MSLGLSLLPRYNIVQVKEGYRNVDEKGTVEFSVLTFAFVVGDTIISSAI